MTIYKTKRFVHLHQRLPLSIQNILAQLETNFLVHPWDPKLHTKKVKGVLVEGLDVYSFRVTRRYRVLYYWGNPETAVWYSIDHRKDVYR